MKAFPRRSAPLLLLVLAVGLGACDVSDPLEGVDLIVDITGAPVELSGAAGTVRVQSGEVRATNSQIQNNTDIKEVRELRAVRFRAEHFSFQPVAAGAAAGGGAQEEGAAGGSGATAESGTITLALFINRVPMPGGLISVTVQDNVVTGVQPSAVIMGQATINHPALQQLIEALSAEERPDLHANWESLTVAQAIEEINTALAASTFPVSLVVTADGNLDGSLQLSEFEFDAQVSLSN